MLSLECCSVHYLGEVVQSCGQKSIHIPLSLLVGLLDKFTYLFMLQFVYLQVGMGIVFSSNGDEVSLNTIRHMRCMEHRTRSLESTQQT